MSMERSSQPEQLFPWQQTIWQTLWQAYEAKRLPHALLFAGMKGIGKAFFAQAFATALLCQQGKAGNFCDTSSKKKNKACHACCLIANGAHPDVLWVRPEKEGQAIKIEQIRGVSDFVNQSSFQGHYRIVLIDPADAMNANAANALLKTLEEPSRYALLILISSAYTLLPATILSRCQRILFAKPASTEAMVWLRKHLGDSDYDPELLLQLTHGAPLSAALYAENAGFLQRQLLLETLQLLSQRKLSPLDAALKLKDIDILLLFDGMLAWLMDILRLQLNAAPAMITNQDYVDALQLLKTQTALSCNLALLNQVQQLRGERVRGINLNKQLIVEEVLIRWVECLL